MTLITDPLKGMRIFMKQIRRIAALALALAMLFSASALAAKKKSSATPTPAPLEIDPEVVTEVPETIRQLLDLAYSEWESLGGKALPNPNKFTKWRNNYPYGWCGGFITWCMLEVGIPQKEHGDIEEGEVEGIVHVKEAGVGKLVTGYLRMNRTTMIPQKGFIVVYGKEGGNGLWHVGLVYDVQKLPDGKYRLTTIEGNLNKTVRMFIHDYDPSADKKKNLSLVPEEERTEQESKAFSYKHQYKNHKLYINMFLMPWIPGR